jgi:hypothetical protein
VISGLVQRSELHVAFAGDDPESVEAFATWAAPGNLTRHVLVAGTGWNRVDDWRASRSVEAALGRGKYCANLQRLTERLQPDVVWYFEVEALRRTGLPVHGSTVLDHCDVRWRKQLRLAQLRTGLPGGWALAKAALLRLDDVQLAMRVKHSLVASPAEVGLLWPARAVSVLPNGCAFPATAPPVTADSNRLIFYGSLFYGPNVDGIRWMCREVWPLIRRHRPDARLDIVGLGHEALAELADVPGVTFHGFVGDLDAIIRQAAALVVPLRVGGGTRVKILEAWAKGLPVVSTTVGAEGLGARDGESLLLGDAAKAFATRCVHVLENADLRRRLAAAGYEHGSRKFDWSVIHAGIEDVLGQGTPEMPSELRAESV